MYRVLLVDDDPIIISGIKRLLDWEKNNCIIAGSASNGDEAIDKIKQLQPDLVISDIAMHGSSGLDLLKQSDAEFPDIVFIMLTNHEDFVYAQKSLRYRAAEYLIKNDLTPDMLQCALLRAIDEREKRNKLNKVSAKNEITQIQQRKERIRNALCVFLETNVKQELLSEEGMMSNFAIAFIPYNLSTLPEFADMSDDEKQKIIDWQAEVTGHLAVSFFPQSMLIPETPQEDFSSGGLILFAWNLKPQIWESNVARFRERLIITSGQITRLGVDVINSGLFPSCAAEANPGQALSQIREQFYRNSRGVHSDAVQKALQYVLNHVEEKITLQDIANFACVSPGYLSTLFKREYSQNLMDFINQTKIDHACERLRDKKMRVNEISYLLGYENAFYFSRVFKRHTGLTPSEFRGRV